MLILSKSLKIRQTARTDRIRQNPYAAMDRQDRHLDRVKTGDISPRRCTGGFIIKSLLLDIRILCLIKFKITTTTTTFKIYDFLERCRKNKGINSTTYTTIRYLQITPAIITGVICRYLVEIVYNVKPLPNIRCRRCKRHKQLISRPHLESI